MSCCVYNVLNHNKKIIQDKEKTVTVYTLILHIKLQSYINKDIILRLLFVCQLD